MVREKQTWVKSMGTAVNLGTSVAAAIAVGLIGGKWLDNRFDMGYLFTILGFLLGVITAGKMMWERLMGESRQRSFLDKHKKENEK
ncbi:MAG: AtpZ/AtpI family protein [Syntrophomonas sp.]|nr:AtpZ/AtpI family protein [Syntrophomonas sp.]